MVLGRRAATAALAVIALAVAACSSSSSSGSNGGDAKSASGPVPIGIDLTYNNTAFWAAYINYEKQYAAQLHIKLIGPLLAAANASLQNQQIEELVNEGAKAIAVNPETATSLGPAISYATAHHVKLISVDTIVSDDGVPFEMCDISKGLTDAAQSQPANLYAYWALKYAVDAAKGVVLKPGDSGGGAPALQMVSYQGDSNLGDPIVAPFVTKSAQTLTVKPVDG